MRYWSLIDKHSLNSLVRAENVTIVGEYHSHRLVGKITSTGSSNIFANREYETLVRSLNLRRLSYAVFTGEKNHFLTQLPSIQEKLVDILRNPNSSLMESEVCYLIIHVYNFTNTHPLLGVPLSSCLAL